MVLNFERSKFRTNESEGRDEFVLVGQRYEVCGFVIKSIRWDVFNIIRIDLPKEVPGSELAVAARSFEG